MRSWLGRLVRFFFPAPRRVSYVSSVRELARCYNTRTLHVNRETFSKLMQELEANQRLIVSESPDSVLIDGITVKRMGGT